MKTICRHIPAAIIFMSFLFSCGKSNKDVTPGQPEKTVDSIKIVSQQLSIPVAPRNPGNHNVWFLYSNNGFYCISASNTPIPEFMYFYSIQSQTYKLLTPNDEVAAAGFVSKLIRGSDAELYYIANEAIKYDVVSGTWSDISYPQNAYDNNGEAGVMYYEGKIYFVGGRVPSRKFKSYNTVTGSWFNEPDFLYNTRMAIMTAIPNDDKLYVLGGSSSHRDFSVFEIASNSWKALPNVTFDVTTSAMHHLGAQYLNRYILVLQNKSIYVYDTKTEKWKKDPIGLNINGNDLNIFTSGSTVYIVGRNPSNDLTLHQLVISDTPQ